MLRLGWVLLAIGCGAGSGNARLQDKAGGDDALTFYGDIAPVLVEKCGSCHRDDGGGPFDVADYQSAVPWAEAMVDAIQTGRMPPFYAESDSECAPPLEFKNDPSLSEEEKQRVADWVAQGKVEGDPYLEGTYEPRVDDVVGADAVLALEAPFTVSGAEDIYQCFRIEVPTDDDVWIQELQVLPDNDRVVHHVLVWNDPDDLSAERVDEDGSYPCSGTPDFWPTDLLAAWTPGGAPMRTPENTGELLKAGATIVVNIHYHPTGDSTETDQTEIALKWTETKPANYVTWLLVDIPFGASVLPGPDDTDGEPEFRIPAGATSHVETLSFDVEGYPIPVDLPIFGVTPHMHYLGTDMQVTIRSETDEDICLIHTPNYTFDFQTSYFYDAPASELPTFGSGRTIEVRCTYDNSPSNPYFEAQQSAAGLTEPVDVGWGEETGDEMCMAMLGLIIPPVDLSDWL